MFRWGRLGSGPGFGGTSHRKLKQLKEITVNVTQQDRSLNLVLTTNKRQLKVFVFFYGGSVKNVHRSASGFHTDYGEDLDLRASGWLESVCPFGWHNGVLRGDQRGSGEEPPGGAAEEKTKLWSFCCLTRSVVKCQITHFFFLFNYYDCVFACVYVCVECWEVLPRADLQYTPKHTHIATYMCFCFSVEFKNGLADFSGFIFMKILKLCN